MLRRATKDCGALVHCNSSQTGVPILPSFELQNQQEQVHRPRDGHTLRFLNQNQKNGGLHNVFKCQNAEYITFGFLI